MSAFGTKRTLQLIRLMSAFGGKADIPAADLDVRRWQSRRSLLMVAISGGRADDERVKCLRIFADGSGETHMEDIDITLQPRKLFKDNPPLRLSENLPASWYNICYVLPVWEKWIGTTRRSDCLCSG